MTRKVVSFLGAVCLIPSFAGLAGCGGIFTCDHEPMTDVASPDGRFSAKLEKVACGATTEDAFWVTLRDKKAFLDKGEVVAVFDHTNNVDVVWLAPRQVVINGNGGKRHAARADWHGVRIAYSGNASDAP